MGKNSVYGYLRLTRVNRTALLCDYMAIDRIDDATGEGKPVWPPYVRDSFVLAA